MSSLDMTTTEKQTRIVALTATSNRESEAPAESLSATFVEKYSSTGARLLARSNRVRFAVALAAVWALVFLQIMVGFVRGQDAPGTSPGAGAGNVAGADANALAEPDRPSDGILPLDRAWEYQHYRVRVWVCTDGSAVCMNLLPSICTEVSRMAQLLDTTGWEVFVQPAPNPWQWRCHRDFSRPEALSGLSTLTELKFDDKLIVVRLADLGHAIDCQTRELDITTGQWGATQLRQTSQLDNLSYVIADSVRSAFMPLARIEHVPTDNSIVMRARGVDGCLDTFMDENKTWVSARNNSSPVAIQPQDNFLPVLRKTDRSGKLESIEAIPFTFIHVETIDGTKIIGQVHSMVRAPLSGRTSKRLQKLALVIRPQPRPTTLRLHDSENPNQPMEGLEIYARRPELKPDDPMDFLGKTDWRGIVQIPPGDQALRLVYLRRGGRSMKKLPIIPGFHDFLETDVNNDEARLFAQGVVLGLQSEILDLVVQREVYEQRIAKMIENGALDMARKALVAYQELPNAQKLQTSVGDEQIRLETQAKTEKETKLIRDMFAKIKTVLNEKIAKTREAELRQKLQDKTPAPPTDQGGTQ